MTPPRTTLEAVEYLRAALGFTLEALGPDDILVVQSDRPITPADMTLMEAAIPPALRERFVVLDVSLRSDVGALRRAARVLEARVIASGRGGSEPVPSPMEVVRLVLDALLGRVAPTG